MPTKEQLAAKWAAHNAEKRERKNLPTTEFVDEMDGRWMLDRHSSEVVFLHGLDWWKQLGFAPSGVSEAIQIPRASLERIWNEIKQFTTVPASVERELRRMTGTSGLVPW